MDVGAAYCRDAFITMAICNTVLVSRNCRCKKKTEQASESKDLRNILNHQNSFTPKLRFWETERKFDVEGGGCKCDCVMEGECAGGACDGRTDKEAVLDVNYEAESPDDLALVEVGKE